MKVLTKEEEEVHYAAVLRGGLIGGAVGLGVGLGATVLLHRRSTFFRNLTLPLKTFFVTSSGTFAAIVQADRSSRSFEAARHGTIEFQDSTARLLAEQQATLSGWEKAKNFGREYRYPIVMTSWAASMAGSLGMVSRDKYLTAAQKLVQARMYAQGLTLLILVATAAFEVDNQRNKRVDEVVRVKDPNHPGQFVEKTIHHENYAGEDLWKG
jgi:hypothetical protein